jgi:hypothetical protein
MISRHYISDSFPRKSLGFCFGLIAVCVLGLLLGASVISSWFYDFPVNLDTVIDPAFAPDIVSYPYGYDAVVIDGCEYIKSMENGSLAHKGNCRNPIHQPPPPVQGPQPSERPLQ